MRAGVLGLALCALVTAPAHAQRGELTLAEAIELAVQLDPAGRALAERIAAARSRADGARIGYAPDATAALAVTDGFAGSGNYLRAPGMMGSPLFDTYAVGVTATWDVLEILHATRRADVAEEQAHAAEALRAIAARDMALVVIVLFEQALMAEAQVAVLEAELEARRRVVEALRARAEAGRIPGLDVLEEEAALAEIAAAIAISRARVASGRSEAAVLVGDRALEAPLVWGELPHGDGSAEARLAGAHRARARWIWALHDERLIPRITIAGSVGYASPGAGLEPGFWSVGAALVFPLTQALQERAELAARAHEAEADAEEARTTELTRVRAIARLRAELSAIDAASVASAESVRAAELALSALEARSEAGRVAAVELEQAHTRVRRARLERAAIELREASLRSQLVVLDGGSGE